MPWAIDPRSPLSPELQELAARLAAGTAEARKDDGVNADAEQGQDSATQTAPAALFRLFPKLPSEIALQILELVVEVSPTVKSPTVESPTVESPTVESAKTLSRLMGVNRGGLVCVSDLIRRPEFASILSDGKREWRKLMRERCETAVDEILRDPERSSDQVRLDVARVLERKRNVGVPAHLHVLRGTPNERVVRARIALEQAGKMTGLESWHLNASDSWELRAQLMATIRAVLEKNPQLREIALELEACNLGDRDVARLAESVAQSEIGSTATLSLNVRHNRIGEAGARILATKIPQLTSVEAESNRFSVDSELGGSLIPEIDGIHMSQRARQAANFCAGRISWIIGSPWKSPDRVRHDVEKVFARTARVGIQSLAYLESLTSTDRKNERLRRNWKIAVTALEAKTDLRFLRFDTDGAPVSPESLVATIRRILHNNGQLYADHERFELTLGGTDGAACVDQLIASVALPSRTSLVLVGVPIPRERARRLVATTSIGQLRVSLPEGSAEGRAVLEAARDRFEDGLCIVM